MLKPVKMSILIAAWEKDGKIMEKIKIRKGMFETNSSSAHTICITGNTGETDPNKDELLESHKSKPDANGNFYLTVDSDSNEYDFGQDLAILDSWYDKLAYTIAIYNTTSKLLNLNVVVDILKDEIPGCIGIEFLGSYADIEMDIDTDVAVTSLMSNSWDNGIHIVVDHQSTDLYDNFFDAYRSKFPDATEKEILKKIIFSNDIMILTCSDADDFIYDIMSTGFMV